MTASPSSAGDRLSGLWGRRTWFVVLILFAFMLTNRHQWATDVRTSADDGIYLAYAMSMGMDMDLDFSNEIRYGAYMAANKRSPGGFYGPGLMAAPFVGLFSLVDRALGNPVITDRDQFRHSWSYFGFSFATHVYFLLSVLLSWKIGRAFPERASRQLVTLFCISSGVLFYVLVRPRMGHAFEFFTLTLATYGTVRAWEYDVRRRSALLWTAVAGLGVALSVAIKLSNVFVILLPVVLILMIDSSEADGPSKTSGHRLPRLFGLYAAGCIAFLVPVALLNDMIYDAPFPSETQVYGVRTLVPVIGGLGDVISLAGEWLRLVPNIPVIFFGAEFGLLYSSPLVVFGLFGASAVLLGGAARHSRWMPVIAFVAVIAYFLLNLSIVLFWKSTASSYGYRYLFPLFPVGFVGYLLWWLGPLKAPRRRRTVAAGAIHGALLALCVFSLMGQAFFAKSDKLSYRTGMTTLGRIAAAAPDFNRNLLKEVFSVQVWNRTLKDGVFGFVNKMAVNRTVIRWTVDQTVHGGGKGAREPNWQHPPVVWLFFLTLATLWFGFFRYFRRLELEHDSGTESG
jgi:hypothetical protein